MEVRFLKAKDGDIASLAAETHRALSEAGYNRLEKDPLAGEGSGVAEIRTYTSGSNVIVAKYSHGPKFVMHDAHGVNKGTCEGRLYFDDIDPAELERIDAKVASIKPGDL